MANTGAGFDAQGSGTAGGCANHCSGDLHSFVDCNDNVITTCPDDQACAPDGSCIAPCEAAKQNQSTLGCDFFAVTPSIVFGSRGGCFAAMVANTWTAPVSVSIEYDGQTLDAGAYTYLPQGSGTAITYTPLPNGMLDPGQLGIVMLSQYASFDPERIPCPVPSAINVQTALDTSGRGKAFHVGTTAPVVAYDVYPWGGAQSFATSSTLLLPTPSWGTNFVTVDAWEMLHGQPFTQIVASEDATVVTLVPKAAIPAGNGLPPMPANTATSFTLERGDVVELMVNDRLAGSKLQSDKPVSVWGGSSCMNIPTSMDACDTAHQELAPVQSLGNRYVAARYPSRGGDDTAPLTLVGMVDGTSLTFDPPVSGAPSSLSTGEVAIIESTSPFVVESQDADHPFYLAAHMTGGSTNDDGLGDPDYVNVVPPEQYLSRYVFVTDPTYAVTSLVFVRKKRADGTFAEVSLDCLGPVPDFEPVGSTGDYEVARLKMVDHGSKVGSCDNGVHSAGSAAPFGLTVWGYDYYASYAYPAGMSTVPINQVVVPPVPQ